MPHHFLMLLLFCSKQAKCTLGENREKMADSDQDGKHHAEEFII